ncbi:hypothetical protein JYB55_23345 [Mycolicibacterium septicum]|nr:hypothetical protein [Mycolicibacterium septicum]
MAGQVSETADRCQSCASDLRPRARFCDMCGTPVGARPEASEYKQVTVLFADVVGSMRLAAAVDTERLREIMNDLFNRAAAVVQRYGGTVDKFTGDGAVQALAHEPVHVVATMPAGLPPGIESTANATVCEFVPHALVLDRAVCAVTHGGMGATQKALARGIPVCVVPYGRDQLEVARRVEVARCGTRLPARRLTPDRLRDKVREAMRMADGARRVAAGFAATGGVSHGADVVERRLLGRTR